MTKVCTKTMNMSANKPSVPGNGRENRSPRTIETYISHAKPFIEAYCAWKKPHGCSDPFADLTPEDWAGFPAWFAGTYRNAPWCRRTLMLVKISLVYVLGGLLGAHGKEAIRSFRPAHVREKGFAGIALHEKNPAPGQIQGILSFLDGYGTFLASLAAAWFRAELVTGLRPKEWAHATYREDDFEGTLSVINGKQNAMLRQGTGILRHLVFRGPELASERRVLREFFVLKDEYFRQYRESKGYTDDKCFSRMLRNCQQVYRIANDYLRQGRPVSMEEKNITLYSLRNAFKADAFNLSRPGPERRMAIAALMGHSSLYSQDMYAPENRATGRSRMPVSPLRQEQPFPKNGTMRQEEACAKDMAVPADRFGAHARCQGLRPYPV